MATLAGRRIVVTRDEDETGPLSRALRAVGAVPLPCPTVRMEPLHDPSSRGEALPPLEGFDWLVITSPRTVTLLAETGTFVGPKPRRLRIAVVGERTAAALAREGWTADRLPEEAGAEPLLRALVDGDGTGSWSPGRVLFPASTRAGDILPAGLEAAGFEVVRLDLYGPRPLPQDPAVWAGRIREGVDAVTFTSPSAVAGLTDGITDPGLRAALRSIPAGVQGPTTATAAREAGWRDVVEARPRSFQGLVAALAGRFLGFSDPSPNPDLQHA